MNDLINITRKGIFELAISPITYLIIILFALLVNISFVSNVFVANQASLRAMFEIIPLISIIIFPAITMNNWSEEKKLGTIELLLNSPIKDWKLVLGKFIATYSFSIILMVTTISSLLLIVYLGNPDRGEIITGYFGLGLLFMMLVALGQLISINTSNQITSFLISLVLFGILYIFGYNGFLEFFPNQVAEFLQYLSFNYHFESIARGVIDIRAVSYFLSITTVSLLLINRSLKHIKQKGT